MDWSNDSIRKKWDAKYLKRPSIGLVDRDLVRFYGLAKRGQALDIACGSGANALFLAHKGFETTCVDISPKALERFHHPKIRKVCSDIERFQFGRYDLVICFNFLERAIFEAMKRALKEDGILIYKTFTYRSSMKRAYALRRNELLTAFEELEILHYEMGEKALLVARNA